MRKKMIETLLQHGLIVNPNDVDNPGLLSIAVEKGSLKIVEDLLKYREDINMLVDDYSTGLTPLHSAVKGKQVQMAKLLLNYGANINVKDSEGTTPIVNTIQNNDIEMTELILTNGADIKQDPKVLCTAVKMGSLKMVEDLLKYGADVNMLDNSNYRDQTLLHHAVIGKQLQMAKVMIKYGANINVTDGWGTTPIAYAIQNGDTEMAKLLVANGVDVKNNPNLLHYSVINPICYNCTCIRLTSFFNSCYDSRYRTRYDRRCMQKIVELLLSKGANVNVKSESGMTTLFAASRSGYKEIVGILLKYGAECDPGAGEDIKPLHAAAVEGHSKIVEILLKFGAEVNSRDMYGRTALHFAFRGKHEQIIRTLLEYGSDVNIISIKNHTPLEYGGLTVDFTDRNDYNYCVRHYNDSRYYTNNSPSTKLLKQHIAKMKAGGLHISERNLLGISNDDEINNFLNKCEAEIEIMKSEKIDNSCASFYDILTNNTSQLAKNKSIVRALRSNDYKTKFPIYASMIDSRFRREVKREKLLEQVRKKFLHSLFGRLPELPLLCADKIFSYLSDKDLKILLVT
ncbi:uncharacterized protein LOC143213811 [Lasioglossum baleicum]|uniref:uncharacterized protein LOC143213811 n=1 Tax=Lasioglossum baleicum TaxID=434251 RepID=UPI003FCCD77F